VLLLPSWPLNLGDSVSCAARIPGEAKPSADCHRTSVDVHFNSRRALSNHQAFQLRIFCGNLLAQVRCRKGLTMRDVLEYLALAIFAIVVVVVVSEWLRARKERAIYRETQRRKV